MITKIRVAIHLAEDGTRMGRMQFQLPISLNLRAVYSSFISFDFPSPKKSISFIENYKSSCAVFSRDQIETAAAFFWICNKWSRGY